MLLVEFFDQPNVNKVNEMAEKMADIVVARELIGQALGNTAEKQKYFDFLKHLRDSHGAEYSTDVHKEAAKLAKKKEAVDGQ